MNWLKSIPYLLSILLAIGLTACTSGGGGGDDGGASSSSSSEPVSGGAGEFRTDCGVVLGGSLRNPVSASEGVVVDVQVTGPNQAIVTSGGQQFLVKFHGLRNISSSAKRNAAISQLESMAQGKAVYFEAESECTTTVDGGGTAFVGQLFTLGGDSYNEELIAIGLAEVSSFDGCSGSLIGQCYQALEDTSEQVGTAISNFLWKPESERDGRLVVLLNPGGATIVANGETLTPSGSSNGRGTTARGTRSGCGYGANVRVQAFDRQGRVLLFPGGAREFIIQNGCDRVEF